MIEKRNKKVLITVPSALLDQADTVALSLHMSRCEFFRQAVRAAIARSNGAEACGPAGPSPI